MSHIPNIFSPPGTPLSAPVSGFRLFLGLLAISLFAGTASCADASPVLTRAHAFYYSWYGNPETNGRWLHWDHAVAARTKEQEHTCVPPDDIGANFYPAMGLYSSLSSEDVRTHMRQLRRAGVGVVSATWWGRADYTDQTLKVLFDAAAEEGLAVNFHIEPFGGRNGQTLREALVYLLDKYGEHPALYREPALGNRPMAYIYDSYLTPAEDWARVLSPEGENTIRGTKYDTAVIGLWVKGMSIETDFMLAGHFDGVYTYFGIDGFTFGSSIANWPRIAAWARANDKVFIPSVGPGYEDRKIRPWNGRNSRARENGAYYDRYFEAALAVDPPFVSISTFNEWHEGTQIAPAVPKQVEGVTYLDYEERDPNWYLDRTRYWLERWGSETSPK